MYNNYMRGTELMAPNQWRLYLIHEYDLLAVPYDSVAQQLLQFRKYDYYDYTI